MRLAASSGMAEARRYLALIGTADGSAIAVRGDHASKSRLWLYLKHWIDRRWMARYTDLQMTMPAAPPRLAGLNGEPDADQSSQAPADPAFAAMRCLGCGAKTGHEIPQCPPGGGRICHQCRCRPGADARSRHGFSAAPGTARRCQNRAIGRYAITDHHRPIPPGRIAANVSERSLCRQCHLAAALAIVNLAEARIDLQQDQLTQLLAGG